MAESEVVAEVPFFCMFLSFLFSLPSVPLPSVASPPKRNLKGKQANAPLGLLTGVVVAAEARLVIGWRWYCCLLVLS